MKIQHLSVIFIIIVLPIILLLSYYVSLQIDTINMQTAYRTKQLEATKEAIEAFEINTVEWNEAYSETADSKRRDIMASINTFTTSFANGIGKAGASKEEILPYIPAVAFTLYDGYYIYSPAEVKEVIKDENGVAVFMADKLRVGNVLQGYNLNRLQSDKGKILYQLAEGKAGDGTYKGTPFTLNPTNAKTTYSHMLKPFTTYSARYKKTNVDITVNYALDNYITITGVVNGNYVTKSGYLINTNIPQNIGAETLTEEIWYKGLQTEREFSYIYAEDNTKVYFDGNTAFQVNSNDVRTDISKMGTPKYKKLNRSGNIYYQALANYDLNKDNQIKEQDDIIQGKWYRTKGDVTSKDNTITIGIKNDVSAINYYSESYLFSSWVYSNLGDLKVEDMQSKTEQIVTQGKIFENVQNEDSVFNEHKRQVIKQSLISNLNQAITSYSRNTEGEYNLPVLSEIDWDQILRNVSIITFIQDVPIGMKYYNDYAIATSTSNKEYVNIDEIYLSTKTKTDDYYHLPYCEKLTSGAVIGYRNIDYVVKEYEINDDEEKYYYKHSSIANKECYYCLVQRNLFKQTSNNLYKNAHKLAYDTALARERYVTHEFK